MASWTTLAGKARAAQLAHFGFTASFQHGADAPVSVKAAWTEAFPDGNPRKFVVLLVEIGASDGQLPASFTRNDTVTVEGQQYRIHEIDRRTVGLSRVTIERIS